MTTTVTMETISEHRCFGGVQGYYRHDATATRCPMRFSAYVPPHKAGATLPVLYYLSGLTCTEENFTVKAAVQRHAAERGFVVVAPDTSPRGEGVPDADRYDLGQGAGFYVNATVEPWSRHYRMYDYVVEELPAVVAARFPIDPARQGIFGHSMGGHGALTVGLRHPDRFRSVSALAPICGPSRIEFGKAILEAYLGADKAAWAGHDAVSLVEAGRRTTAILIDQGDADEFYLGGNMMTETFEAACRKAGQPVEVRFQAGYDHSYFFVQTFIADHLAHHARIIG